MRGFRPVHKLSTWRRLALHTWHRPSDPTVHGMLEIEATEALAYIRALRDRSGAKVTVTHLVGHAVARAIAERPEVNAIVRMGRIYQRETIDVFFQVAFEGGENLAGHKVARANEKSVVDIARELAVGAGSVREGKAENVKATKKFSKLPPSLLGLVVKASEFVTYDLGLDLSKYGVPYDGFGSAMVTNVGSFGLSMGLPPLVPFSRCPLLLLVGEVTEKPIVVKRTSEARSANAPATRGSGDDPSEHQIVARPVLPIGVTFDHRLLDGYQAGILAKTFRAIIERPFETLGEIKDPALDRPSI